MASRTVQEKAAKTVADGNADFTVVAAEPSTNGVTKFIVTVPMTLTRPSWHRAETKFGSDLLAVLGGIDGVDPSLSSRAPHLVVIHVEDVKAGDEPGAGFRHQSKGLPNNICVAIQEVIDCNRGPIQTLTEWLRRFI